MKASHEPPCLRSSHDILLKIIFNKKKFINTVSFLELDALKKEIWSLSAAHKALKAPFLPQVYSGTATLADTEEAVSCHMKQQTQNPQTIWTTKASPRSSLPAHLPGNKSR